MNERLWMVHDTTYRAIVAPFASSADAEDWRREHGLRDFGVAPLDEPLRRQFGERPVCSGRPTARRRAAGRLRRRPD